MAGSSATGGEKRFDSAFWLILAVVVVFTFLAMASVLDILALPSDGWQIIYDDKPPPPLSHFSGGWSTNLRAGDRVLAVNHLSVGGGEALSPQQLAAWQTGQKVTYTILRNGQPINLPVTLHRLDAGGFLRSFWFTMKDSPLEWSWSIIAILIFILRPRNRAAQLMFLAFFSNNVITKLAWAATTISRNFAPAPVFYLDEFVTFFWGYLFFPAIILLGISFPQRIFPLTRWPRAVPLLLFGIPLVLSLVTEAIRSEPLSDSILISEAILILLSYGAALLNAFKLSHNAAARAQAIWVIFGFAVSFLPLLVSYLLGYFGILDLGNFNWIFDALTTLVLPICLAIAITRYHLFDVYVIIRRTLQYSLLTLVLAAIYLVSVLLLQSIFNVIFGQSQDIAIVLSTLAIAAMFNPLRRRVQRFIDRRFFRSKYDAERILLGFAARAREEVALEPITVTLLNVVDETMQPEHVSLWLLDSGKQEYAVARGKGADDDLGYASRRTYPQ